MNSTNDTTSVIRVVVAFLMVLGYLYVKIRFSEAPYIKRNLKQYLIFRNLDNVYRPYLEQYFSFYNSLGKDDKLMFEKRVQKFIDIKQFIPRGIKEVTPEMKAMIAGCAIQITFGYPDVYFRHFWRILIYSDSYYSTITRKYHMGEVNAQGFIILSWKSFMEGFRIPHDGHNLGFHEMAHALRLINIVENEEYDFYDREIMREFENEAYKEASKIRNHPSEATFFRNYYLTNVDEFFSVSVECFFEKSVELKNYNPRLYAILTKILKIDPIALQSVTISESIAS